MGRYYSLDGSALFWRVDKVHYISDKYVKLRMLVFFKSTNDVCQYLNEYLSPKNFKIRRCMYDSWKSYEVA